MTVSNALIKPLYHLGENQPALRGTKIRSAIFRTMENISRHQAKAAQQLFDTALACNSYLPIQRLPSMLEDASRQSRPQRWDKRHPKDKAKIRADEVCRSVGGSVFGKRIIELACGDGRVGMHLAMQGAIVTGVDLSDHAMAPEAVQYVQLLVGDAAKLNVEDHSIDALYSFDAFEHFSDPADVLREAHRVLKPGGRIYASFGPLWNSPFGAHQWGRIDLPYLHLLFDRHQLDQFADQTNRKRITVSCNEKPISYFRWMVRDFDSQFHPVSYIEKFNVSFCDMIRQHATIFRSRVDSFDELIVRSIEFVLEKR